MFGFPTKLSLFWDKKKETAAETEISSRPLDHAVWAFSPGAEIPKDKGFLQLQDLLLKETE